MWVLDMYWNVLMAEKPIGVEAIYSFCSCYILFYFGMRIRREFSTFQILLMTKKKKKKNSLGNFYLKYSKGTY